MSVQTVAAPPAVADAAPDRPLPPLPPHWTSLARAFVHRAREQPGRLAMADSTGASLTYGQAFLRSVALGRALARELGPEPNVGLLVPPTVPAAVANIALALFGKVPVNLNYTAGPEAIAASMEQAGIRRVITSRRALEKLKIEPRPEHLMLEDLAGRVGRLDKAVAALEAKLAPISALGALLPGLRNDKLDDTATIIFTSGSTGTPKGVVLSNRNILSNVLAVDQHLVLLEDETLLGVLPFFHSMGFTVTLWMVLCLGKRSVFHVNPLDARTVGKLCQEHKVTLLIGTPTFMRAYLSRCEREQFATVKRVVLGAEKLKPELAKDIREHLGTEPLEGYGCTETAPVVAVNVDHEQALPDGRRVPGNRPGTVGRPVPGTAIRTSHPDTREPLPRGVEGVVEVKGPQVMAGYLNRPDLTAEVIRDGWYYTGDIGYLDEDGFLRITDRMSRFSKIGGEMVPHVGVESAIMEAAGVNEQAVAVTALPDPKRGERLVVVYTDLGAPPAEIYRRLNETPLPKLWIPSADSFVHQDEIPIKASGKVDLSRLKEIARAALGGT